MRIFISADIEGVAGIASRDEATKGSPGYERFRAQMDAEVAAACAGAFAAGATDVVVKDAHGDGRNLDPGGLPAPASLIRGYNGHPFAMVQGLDETFTAAMFVGYHSGAGGGGNPLSHTLSSSKLFLVRLDGEPVSEFRLHALAAGSIGVPVALVTGDRALCEEATVKIAGCTTVAAFEGAGASTKALHPSDSVAAIRAAAESAMRSPLPAPLVPQPPHRLEVVYRDPAPAFVRGFYPGAHRVDERTVGFDADDYFDILRAIVFLVGIG